MPINSQFGFDQSLDTGKNTLVKVMGMFDQHFEPRKT